MKFRTNKIIEKNKKGKKGVGLGLLYPSAEAIEIIGMLGGFDFVQLLPSKKIFGTNKPLVED